MRPPSTERDGERKLLWAAFQVSYYLDELAVLLIRLPYARHVSTTPYYGRLIVPTT